MCWNANVSMNTFLLGIFAILLGLKNNLLTPYESIYYLLFMSMQLVEYVTWNHLNNQSINTLMSKLGMMIIVMLPFVGIITFSKRNHHIWFLLSVYMLFLLFVFPFQNTDFKMSRAENGHLAWHWLNVPFWIPIIYFFIWLSPFILQARFVRILINSVIFFVIYATYLKSSTWGSMWCWIGNVFSLYIIASVFSKDMC